MVSSVDHTEGSYRFVPGIDPYSAGVRALDGHRIVHATFRTPVPWPQGFERIDQVLAEWSRSSAALCSIELRCPRPHTFDDFASFNQEYRAALSARGLLLTDGSATLNPIARTNVAPMSTAPMSTAPMSTAVTETVLYGFGFTAPGDRWADSFPAEQPSFVIAGAGDLRDQSDLNPDAIVRAGERWRDAGEERAAVVLDEMEARLAALDLGWDEAAVIDVYTLEPLRQVAQSVLVDRIGVAAVHGIHWYLAAPPILGLTFEMDVRGGVVEIWL